MEEQIIKDLIEKSIVHLERNEAFYLKSKYEHPRHKNLEFILELKNDSEKGRDYFLLYFIVSRSLSTYCRSRLSEGNKSEILKYLQSFIKDVSYLVDDLPNYYRTIFSDN